MISQYIFLSHRVKNNEVLLKKESTGCWKKVYSLLPFYLDHVYSKHDSPIPYFIRYRFIYLGNFFAFSEPEENDEEVVSSYLQDLIMDKNLEQVDLVIKFLKR